MQDLSPALDVPCGAGSTALGNELLSACSALGPPEAGRLPDASKLTVPTLSVSAASGNAGKLPTPRLSVSASENFRFTAFPGVSGSPRANSASNHEGDGGIPYSC